MTPLVDPAVLALGGPTNARAPGSPGGQVEARNPDSLQADLRAARARGARTVIPVGGEPTLRRDFPTVLGLIRRSGFRVGLATNGRMLAYPRVRRLILDARVTYLRVGLHSARSDVHDRLVRVPGAFEQTLGGLRSLIDEGARGSGSTSLARCWLETPAS